MLWILDLLLTLLREVWADPWSIMEHYCTVAIWVFALGWLLAAN